MDFEDKVCPEPKQAISDEKLLALWRSLPSDYKQFDELVLQFGRLVMSTITPCVKTDIALQSDSDKTSETLLPCPFCGSKADDFNPDGDMEGYTITCSGKTAIFAADASCCPMHTFSYKTESEAIAAWNRRFDSQDAPLTDEQIHDLLANVCPSSAYTTDGDEYTLTIDEIRALLAQVKTEPCPHLERISDGKRVECVACHAVIRDSSAQVKQPKTDSVHQCNALAGSLDGPTECGSLPAWISVEDRLPGVGSNVLAFWMPDNGRPVNPGCFGTAVYSLPDYWCNPEDEDDVYATPSYWMQLPSAPTEPLYGASTEPRQAPQAKLTKQDLDLCAPSDKEPTQ